MIINIKCNEHNYLATLAEVNSTYQKVIITITIKIQIVTQNKINISAHQIFSSLCFEMGKENPIYKAEDINNQYTYQQYKKLDFCSSI